mmetsp:Transcript_104956/g.338450  ORF Transcript_104956/g.338450 Transcript_104956/m.338450 type:complete len:461 (-) Transcript_104956:151-1533(-)
MAGAVGLGPWLPFLCAFLGRAFTALFVALAIEGQVLGLVPPSLRSVALYGLVAFVGSALVRQIAAGFLQGPTPDLAVSAEAGTFMADAVAWVACSMRGWRDAMEDAHVAEMLQPSVFPSAALFAVLDGHGGKEVSALTARLLTEEIHACGRGRLKKGGNTGAGLAESLEEALPRLDARLKAGSWGLGRMLPGPLHPFASCGSTACVAAVDFESREVLVANVGDSRAMLIRNGKAIALSEDHKPENPKERSRIRAAGGQVVKVGPCHRVDGTLNLSRALGDFHLKANSTLPPESQKVIAFADSTRTPFQGGPQELLVVACDGLFERCSNQEVADIIWPRLARGMALEQIGRELLHACCARACRGRPVEQGTDNETVILVKLPALEAAGEPAPLCPGQRVRINGLEGEVGQRLNGQIGVVESSSPGSELHEVRLASGGEVKQLKAANLRDAEASSPATSASK